MYRALSLFLFVGLGLAARAQTPDPTAPARYLPLDVGNTWTYTYNNVTIPSAGTFTWTVEAANVEIDGFAYAQLRERRTQTAPALIESETVFFARLDSVGFLFTRETSFEDEVPWLQPFCPLSAPFGATCYRVPGVEQVRVTGGLNRLVVVGDDTSRTAVKRFAYRNRTLGVASTASFAADIGYLGSSSQGTLVGSTTLIRYHVGGGMVRATLPAVAATIAPPYRLMDAYPNPFTDAVTLRLAPAAAATLVLTDVLGRTVWQQALPERTVAQTVPLDLRPLAPGLYVLTLTTADGLRVTQRLVKQ